MSKNFVETSEVCTVKSLQSVTCDVCKENITIHPQYDDMLESRFHTVEWHAGYGSHLDGKKFEFDICDNCSLKFTHSL